jgi:hypothetical protein
MGFADGYMLMVVVTIPIYVMNVETYFMETLHKLIQTCILHEYKEERVVAYTHRDWNKIELLSVSIPLIMATMESSRRTADLCIVHSPMKWDKVFIGEGHFYFYLCTGCHGKLQVLIEGQENISYE